jgi:hypothetical protein
MNSLLKEKKGVAGLNVYLSLITMLFMIGVIVMVFLIAGNKLAVATYSTGTTGSAVNESVTRASVIGAGATLSAGSLRDVACGTITAVYNGTGGVSIAVGNYTQAGTGNCVLTNTSSMATYTATSYLVSYPYTYSADNDATQSINATGQSIKTATDFFPTFIVLGSMVVLVLLTVIIINSIRATGIVSEGA